MPVGQFLKQESNNDGQQGDWEIFHGVKVRAYLITIGVLRFVAFQDYFAELRAYARLLRVCLEI
jgi:hypothetical protein